jgi:hypothetical protein
VEIAKRRGLVKNQNIFTKALVIFRIIRHNRDKLLRSLIPPSHLLVDLTILIQIKLFDHGLKFFIVNRFSNLLGNTLQIPQIDLSGAVVIKQRKRLFDFLYTGLTLGL